MKRFLIPAALIVFTNLLTYSIANAQCKSFTKRNCLSELSPYLSNGQLNAASMTAGETAEMEINFNKGLSYRLLICVDPYFENTSYQIKDLLGNPLSNDTIKKGFSTEDIKVDRTQTLKLSIQLPPNKSTTDIVRNGCVTVLVGFKD